MQTKKHAVFGKEYTPTEITEAFESAVLEEICKHQKQGDPIARYDIMSNRAYMELPDGTREYLDV